MRGRDRVDDREPQSVSATVAGPGAVQSLEWLEETPELFGRDGRAGVRDRHEGVAIAGTGRDLDISTGRVVAERVVEEVGDEALDESWIALGRRRAQRCTNVEFEICDL